MPRIFIGSLGSALCLLTLACNKTKDKTEDTPKIVSSEESPLSLSLDFERIPQSGFSPFRVRVSVLKQAVGLAGQTLALEVPKGAVSAVNDRGDGIYDFTVTPDRSGIYPVTVSVGSSSLKRDALVLSEVLEGAGQAQLVPGLVNTSGYEDGITITPDGQYLFVQYGPFYFSGLFNLANICAESGWSMYNLATCASKPDSKWVFDSIGPYVAPERPKFPTAAIDGGKLTHFDIVIQNVVNKLALFPSVFYGFKKQSDGSFAEPFKVAFNDAKGANGPFGLSFQMTSTTTARFAVAWNNYFNDLGDDKPDIYSGTMTLGQDVNLGDVVYSGEFFQSITPNIQPVNFATHSGVQGNPHLYENVAGAIESIWVDDEQVSHDLSVYQLTTGAFPDGAWTKIDLPPKINTVKGESQPFFTGKRLYLTRDTTIVYHEFLGSGSAAYGLDASWGDEVVVLKGGDVALGGIFGVGEPTLAQVDGKTVLYFAYVETRSEGSSALRKDFDLGAAFVPLD